MLRGDMDAEEALESDGGGSCHGWGVRDVGMGSLVSQTMLPFCNGRWLIANCCDGRWLMVVRPDVMS